MVIIKTTQTPLILEVDLSKQLRSKNPFGHKLVKKVSDLELNDLSSMSDKIISVFQSAIINHFKQRRHQNFIFILP